MNRAATIQSRSTTEFFSTALALDLAGVGMVAAAGALLAARWSVAPLALVLLAAGLALRVAQYRSRLLRIPLQLPALVFVIAALYSASIAFDPAAAQRKLLLIAIGVALYFVIATLKTKSAMRVVVWGLLLVCAGVGLYFVTQTDFRAEPTKVGVIDEIGLLLHRLSPQFGWSTPHANVIAGILMLGLPFAFNECYQTARGRQWLLLIPAVVISLLIAFALLLTTSRGAWLSILGLVVGSALFYIAVKVARRAGYSANIGIAAAFNVLLLVLILAVVWSGARGMNLFDILLGSAGNISRVTLYQQVLQLNQDFFWTGAGLDTFSPTFSTYYLLIGVPFIAHAHNLWLQIWFEQGLFGLLAFVWLNVEFFFWAFQRKDRINGLALAGLGAVTLMLLHGLVDVPIYFSRILPLMFIPYGLTVCALEPFKYPRTRLSAADKRKLLVVLAASGILAIGALVFSALRFDSLRAQYEANRGALLQSQVELPEILARTLTPTQVRQQADLEPASALYLRALELDPHNRVAHTRLGLIALDRHDFDAAVQELQAAYAQDPTNRAVVKALGLALVWSGQLDAAEPLLAQIPEAASELSVNKTQWDILGRADLSKKAVAMLARLKP